MKQYRQPPVGRERREGGTAFCQLLGDFIAQQTAEPRRDSGQFRSRLRRDWLPPQKIVEPRDEFRRGGKLRSRLLDVAFKLNDRSDEFAVLPEAETIAISVQQVGERLQPLPLLFVLPFVLAWVGPFAGGLDFDIADERFSQRDGVVGPRLEVRKRRFSDGDQPVSFEAADLGQVGEEAFERGAELILGFARGAGVREFGFGFVAKS